MPLVAAGPTTTFSRQVLIVLVLWQVGLITLLAEGGLSCAALVLQQKSPAERCLTSEFAATNPKAQQRGTCRVRQAAKRRISPVPAHQCLCKKHGAAAWEQEGAPQARQTGQQMTLPYTCSSRQRAHILPVSTCIVGQGRETRAPTPSQHPRDRMQRRCLAGQCVLLQQVCCAAGCSSRLSFSPGGCWSQLQRS